MYSFYLTIPCSKPKPMPTPHGQPPTVLWTCAFGRMPTPSSTMYAIYGMPSAQPWGCM